MPVFVPIDKWSREAENANQCMIMQYSVFPEAVNVG